MWEISFADQTLTFLLSIPAGAAMCLFYDLFRIIRLARNTSTVGVFFQDVLYFAVCAFFTFCFLIVRCNGEIRGYVLLGELLGFLACRCSLSALVLAAAGAIYRFFRRLFQLIGRPVRALYGAIGKRMAPAKKYIGKIPQIVHKGIKKLLQAPRRLVYNHSNKKSRKQANGEEPPA